MRPFQPVDIKPHGINKDIEESELAPDKWSDGRNVHFQHGSALRTPGEGQFANTGRLWPVDIHKFVDNGVAQWWVYAAATAGNPVGIGVTDGALHYDLTPVGWPAIASVKNILTIGIINNLVWINHPEFGPYYWDGDVTHKMVKLPGWPANTSCKVMRTHKQFLMAMCVDDATLGLVEGMVMWSASAGNGIPSTWIPSVTNDAGDKIFSEVTGPIVEGITVRDQFVVSKPNWSGILQYVGGQFVFASRDLFPSLGCLSTGAATEAGNIVYMVTGDMQFVKHDGTTYQNILYAVMQDYLRQALNSQFPQSLLVWRDDALGQVMIGYPTSTSIRCNEAISYEIATGDCGIRDLPMISFVDRGSVAVIQVDWDHAVGPWDTDPDIWNQDASGYQPEQIVFAGGTSGMLQQGLVDTAWSGGPIAVHSWISRSGITMDTWSNRKACNGARPLMEAPIGTVVNFRFGTQDVIDGPTDLIDPVPYVVGVDRNIDFFIDGTLLYVGIDVVGGAPWKYAGLVMNARTSGTSA